MTTTLNLPARLERRARAAARQAGKPFRQFVIDAIERQVRAAEKRQAFVADALRAREEALRSGRAYAFEDVERYFEKLAAGKRATRPPLRRWRR